MTTPIVFLKARDRRDTGTADMFAAPAQTHAETRTRKDGVVQKYYVTMVRNPGPRQRVGYLAGPFDKHEDALAQVEPARKKASEVDPFSDFDSFGTAGVTAAEHKPGVLNEHLGVGKPAPRQVEESAEDISHREWRENYDRVVNGDLASFSDKDILRAAGYANRVQVAHQPKAWDGDAGAKNMIDTMKREEQYLRAELKRREQAPAKPFLVRRP